MENESGIMGNEDLIDSLLVDLNNAAKYLVTGNYVAWCQVTALIGQRLYQLKQGVHNDLESRDQAIESLKAQLREMGAEVWEGSPEEFAERMGGTAEHE